MSVYPYIRLLQSSDSKQIAKLLENAEFSYSQFFNPFAFDSSVIEEKIGLAHNDVFFGLELALTKDNCDLIGFFMLRGLDEGYEFPMYGVFITENWKNKGLGRLSLFYAESYCKVNQLKKLLLKVHRSNLPALNLYLSSGFRVASYDSDSHQILMTKLL